MGTYWLHSPVSEFVRAIAVLVSAVAAAGPAAAQMEWNGSQSDSWFNGLNWNPVGPPGATDDVVIDTNQPNVATVGLAGATASAVTVAATETVNFNISTGGTLASGAVLIGEQTGASGHATVAGIGSAWTIGGTVRVGWRGQGNFQVLNGAQVSSLLATVGHHPGSFGTAFVRGPDAGWDLGPNVLMVGHEGTGTMTISLAGVVNSASGRIANLAGSSGEVTVTTPGSSWNMNQILRVGRHGSATLTISEGGEVNSAEGVIGDHPAGQGTVTVEDSGSAWNLAGKLAIGGQGSGVLQILDGAQVVNAAPGNALIGEDPGSTGSVTVQGAGSVWDVGSGALYVGLFGDGTLSLLDSADVSASFVGIGSHSAAIGTVTVSDGASLIASANLVVGELGSGTLDIADFGEVTGHSVGNIGSGTGGEGLVTLNANAALSLAEHLNVGRNGTGTLNVQGGSTVTNVDGRIGVSQGSTGEVTLSGIGSQWSNSWSLTVGDEGVGELTIEDGAVVSNGTGGTIAAEEGSQGTVTVSGGGAAWNSGAFTSIGLAGDGVLVVESGAQATTSNSAIGWGFSATGQAVVTGTGSAWTVGGSLIVGYQGQSTGILSIDDGGEVNTAASARIGFSSGVSGAVVLSGPGSSWNVGEELLVGRSGTGSLHIGQGASVSVGNEVMVPNPAPFSSGELLVNGALNTGSGTFINAAGWLGGAGEVLGNTTVTGTVAPGFPVGTLAITGDLSLDEDAILDFELDGPTDPGDMLDVSGDLTLDGTLQVTDLGGMTPGDYTLIEYGGVLTDNGLAVSGLPSGLAATVDTSVAGQVILAVEAVPDDVFADRFEE